MIQIAGAVVVNTKKGIVVVNQNYNSWSLPKGHVENGETVLEAAIRETHEETGIPAEALTLIGEVAQYDRSRIKKRETDTTETRHITLFLFTTAHEELSPLDPVNPEAVWVSPDEAAQLLTHPIDKEQFRRIIGLPLFQQVTKQQ